MRDRDAGAEQQEAPALQVASKGAPKNRSVRGSQNSSKWHLNFDVEP